ALVADHEIHAREQAVEDGEEDGDDDEALQHEFLRGAKGRYHLRLNLGNAFRPGLWPTLAMLVLVALFLSLSWWQWQRAQYKRELLGQFTAQAERAPVSLDALLADPTLESFPQYLKVSAAGSYDSAR